MAAIVDRRTFLTSAAAIAAAGTVDKPEFPEYFERYHKNRLLLGIRYGNLWGRDFTKQVGNPPFINGMKLLAQAGLTLDTANPRVELLEAIVRLTDQVPNLRVVLDHLPNLNPTEAERPAYERALADIGQRKQIYVKLSEVARRIDGQVSLDVNMYRDRLDYLIGVFGEDRIIGVHRHHRESRAGPTPRVYALARIEPCQRCHADKRESR